MKIIGNLRPVANKDYIYLMNSNDGNAVKVESWEIQYGARILKINKKGIFKFDTATAGLKLKIVGKVLNPKTKQLVDFSQEIIPLAGTPKILSLKWQDQDDRDIGTKTVGYLDKVKLEIKTQNIPLGEKLSITIYEDEYKDGHSESSRNMGTYTSSAVNKYGNAFLYFNNIHLYQKKLNDLDYKDESEHEFYARVVYKDQINRIEDGIQLKVKNELIQLIKPLVTNKAVVVQKQDTSLKKNDKKKVNVTFNMFFDGTMNNMTNTKSRVAPNSEPNLAGVFNSISNKKDDSYMNFYSNVALLFMNNLIPKNADIISIYTEGIGTVDKQKDQLPPGGIGSSIKIPTTIPFFNIELFKTGIKDKVRRGIALMSEKSSENYFKNKKEIGKVTINVFGFSRGAAAARYFMSQESQIKSVLKLESKADIQFNFIGLFDTVAAYGVYHKNDVSELNLDIGGKAKKVIQLAAADEYRENFKLTDITSSINAGIGYELKLPGAHSDIGGGYGEFENEKRYLGEQMSYDSSESLAHKKFKTIKEKYTKLGWYTNNQFVVEKELKSNFSKTDKLTFSTLYKLYGERNSLPNTYQYIPLAIMLKFSGDYAKMKFDDDEIKRLYSVKNELQSIKTQLYNYAISNDGINSLSVTVSHDQLMGLRNKYLHRSNKEDGLTMRGRYDKNGNPDRDILKG